MNRNGRRKESAWFYTRLKEYIINHKSKKAFEESYYDVDENGAVSIHVRADAEIFDLHSDSAALNGDCFDYIEDKAYFVPISRPLKIVFHGVKKEDRKSVISSYKSRYDLEFRDKCLDLKICKLKAFALMAIGIIALGAGIFLGHFTDAIVIDEIMSTVSTFSMWESVDLLILERSNIKTERFNMAQLLIADIIFEEE